MDWLLLGGAKNAISFINYSSGEFLFFSSPFGLEEGYMEDY